MLRRRRHGLLIIAVLFGIPSTVTFFSLQTKSSSKAPLPISPGTHFPRVRPAPSKRRFTSPAVEQLIDEIKKTIRNDELAWLFENCFPHALDTTVQFDLQQSRTNRPDTFVINDDVDAMWLRDSSAQVHPYLPLMKHDRHLRLLIEGLLLRQLICIQRDPFANAFYKTLDRTSEWRGIDETDMRQGVHERKWGVHSLCYVLRLMHSYWKEVENDVTFFDEYAEDFKKSIGLILETMQEQRRLNGSGSYTFQRHGVPNDPRGAFARPNGLIYGYFRPNDDLQMYPYHIPSQFFAYHTLQLLTALLKKLNWFDQFSAQIVTLSDGLYACLFEKDIVLGRPTIITAEHATHGLIYAYETNGNGDKNLVDDASVPSLLSLPYLCPDAVPLTDPIYQNTRRFVLSRDNPWYFEGNLIDGVGGQHSGYGMVWPIAIIMRGLTSTDDDEIRSCLRMLQTSHGETGLMHESVHMDDDMQFTRSSFAAANSLFGELIWKVYREKPYLLNEIPKRNITATSTAPIL